MERQLRVVKADGSTEPYMHTKVMGAINNALAAAGWPDVIFAEHLAEVVTYYLYDKADRHKVSSNEIFSMIKATLVATGWEEAAAALTEHALARRLKRARTEVLAVDVQDYGDLGRLCRTAPAPARMLWDKGRIVHDLKARSGLPHETARAIAAMAEERIFSMGMTTVPLSLLKQVVLGETASILDAQQQLQAV